VFFSVVGNDGVFLRASLFPENQWRLMGIYTKLAVSFVVFVLAFELGLFADGGFVEDGVFVGGVEAVVKVSGFPEVGEA